VEVVAETTEEVATDEPELIRKPGAEAEGDEKDAKDKDKDKDKKKN
jgi:hypothetical protein